MSPLNLKRWKLPGAAADSVKPIPQRLRRSKERRADDSRCGPHHAAGGAAEISCGDRERQGGLRQRHPARLSDGAGGDAAAQFLSPNRFFAYLFSYLVNTRLTDTLCGTKVLMRRDYEVLARERSYFGDFDLIFGAAKQN
jgi:hypothetical protein